LKKEILDLDEKTWFENVERQNAFIQHKDTQTIFFTSIPLKWNSSFPYKKRVNKNLSPTIGEKITVIVDYLEKFYNGKVGRSMIIRLNPNSEIPVHHDEGYYLEKSHRVHVPILTFPEVIFTVGNEKIHMKEGECYEINNMNKHSVVNGSSSERIHLLLDIIPSELIYK